MENQSRNHLVLVRVDGGVLQTMIFDLLQLRGEDDGCTVNTRPLRVYCKG